MAPKGSVSIDGVSLTVNEVENDTFGINIIPHTQQVTLFKDYQVGTQVNLEIDMLARYVSRLMERG
jgi:riboflavin synthase